MKFSKRPSAVPLQPIWTVMVSAKLDHSRVLVTKFGQNWSTLNGRSAGQRHTDTHTDKLVGFYDPIAPPVPNAPSSEPRNNADATFLDPVSYTHLTLPTILRV